MLTHSPARAGEVVVGTPTTLAHSFHPNLQVLAQAGGHFFEIVADQTIRRGSFCGVQDLVTKVEHFVTEYNTACKPFTWTATIDPILARLERLSSRANGTGHRLGGPMATPSFVVVHPSLFDWIGIIPCQ